MDTDKEQIARIHELCRRIDELRAEAAELCRLVQDQVDAACHFVGDSIVLTPRSH